MPWNTFQEGRHAQTCCGIVFKKEDMQDMQWNSFQKGRHAGHAVE